MPRSSAELADSARDAYSGVVIMNRARESRRISLSASGRTIVDTGTGTAPMRIAAR